MRKSYQRSRSCAFAPSALLEKLFVEPDRIGEGIGAMLFAWALEVAREHGARELIIESDPDAVPFYRGMGAELAGSASSGSIPGRVLPRLTYRLYDEAR